MSSRDRKSTRLNSSHTVISYAVFCLKKKKQVWLTTDLRIKKNLIKFNWTIRKRLLAFIRCLHARIRMTGYMDKMRCLFFFFKDTATTEIYTLSLHDALPI